LDPSKYWWGLTWNALLDFDNFNQEQEQKLYVDFQKAQYSLLHVLSENFGMHDKHIIADNTILFSLWKISRSSTRSNRDLEFLMMILLLFLQKQNLAFAVYQFGSVLSLPD